MTERRRHLRLVTEQDAAQPQRPVDARVWDRATEPNPLDAALPALWSFIETERAERPDV